MLTSRHTAYLNDLSEEVSKIPKETRELVMSAIRAHFPPEFINRIDAQIIFNKLSREDVRKIVDVRVAEIQNRIRKNGRDVTLDLSPEARDYLGSIGFHPSYGARPLNRALQTDLLNPLSQMLIAGAVRDGETARVHFDGRANRLVIQQNHEPMKMDVDDSEDEDVMDEIAVEELD